MALARGGPAERDLRVDRSHLQAAHRVRVELEHPGEEPSLRVEPHVGAPEREPILIERLAARFVDFVLGCLVVKDPVDLGIPGDPDEGRLARSSRLGGLQLVDGDLLARELGTQR